AGLRLTDGDRARTLGREARGVAGGTALADRVVPGAERDRGARRIRARERGRSRAVPRDAHREGGGGGRAPVVVDDVLDDDQLGRAVVVGDGAGLRLADGDRARATGREARGVAGGPGLRDRVGALV